jgi:hypothetical protein
MPAPFVHINKRLADISLRFPDEQPMVRGFFFPRKPVDHLSDLIAQWNRGNILRVDDLDMSGADEELPTIVPLVLDANIQYNCRIYAARAIAQEITSRNSDPSLDYEVERALMVKQRLSQLLEYQAIKGVLRNSTTMSGSFETMTLAEQFDNFGSGDSLPVSKLSGIVMNIESETGGNKVNVCSMSNFTLNAIAASEEFKDRSKYTTLVVADPNSTDGRARILEQLTGMAPGAIKVTAAIYNSAKAGLAESPKQFIGSSVIMAYVAPPSVRSYSFGAGFAWNGYSADPMTIIKVPEFTHGIIPGEEIRAFSVVDFKPLNLKAAYVLDQAVDPTKTGNGKLD